MDFTNNIYNNLCIKTVKGKAFTGTRICLFTINIYEFQTYINVS